jgi:lipoate-protein ligase B
MRCLAIDLGQTNYSDAWDLQRRVWQARVEQRIPDVVLFTEHTHTFTLGKSSDPNHLLATEGELRANDIEVFNIDRGGDITYHGPGQLVGYPILDLHHYGLDVHHYLRSLEELLIRTVAEFGVQAKRDEGFTGVWVGEEKIAALGIKVSRWVTMHGFALNVNTDLSYFDRIIPCGIFHKGVSSLQQLVGHELPLADVIDALIKQFQTVFDVCIECRTPVQLNERIFQQQGERETSCLHSEKL